MKPAPGVSGRADTHSGIQSWPAPRISARGVRELGKDGKEPGWVAAPGVHELTRLASGLGAGIS
jgi:hypothetical protein